MGLRCNNRTIRMCGQLICNQQVDGSNPPVGSILTAVTNEINPLTETRG